MFNKMAEITLSYLQLIRFLSKHPLKQQFSTPQMGGVSTIT